MAAVNELDRFREQWKRELHGHVERDDAGKMSPLTANDFETREVKVDDFNDQCLPFANDMDRNHEKNYETDQDVVETKDNNEQSNYTHNSNESEYYPFKILTQFLNEAPKRPTARENQRGKGQRTLTNLKRKYFSSKTVKESKKKQKESQNESVSKLEDESQWKKNMLDIFISDLNEINEIPFFDTTLPREVAIKIFQHLDLKSLCSCSQVSHSWRSLADDELLWYKVCHNLGCSTDLHVSQGEGWKQRTRQHVQEKRLLNSNWKARICKPYNLNYARGGVLCQVHSFSSRIVAGYTNCQVRSWDVKTGDVCTFNASNTALVLDETTEDLGRIQNEIKHLNTTSSVTAASFRHGFVDIWRNEGGVDPIHTFTFRNPDIASLSVEDVDGKISVVAASEGAQVQIFSVDENSGTCIGDLDMTSGVSHLHWFGSCQSSSSPHLLITCPNSVYLKAVNAFPSSAATFSKMKDESMVEIHNIIWAPVTAVAFRESSQEVAVGYNLYTGPSTQIKINIYDANKNHLKTSLTGHTWLVSCIFMPNLLTHQLVTGSGDRKIRLYDLRVGSSASCTLVGHAAKVTAVEMDDWKVVSGDEGGFVYVWDQRMCGKLWDVHNRHPVQYCHFDDRILIIGNVPYHKFPETDEFETVSSLRYRGTVQVYDFLANQQTQGIPDICLSSYNEPEAYDYNIGLVVPYDCVN